MTLMEVEYRKAGANGKDPKLLFLRRVVRDVVKMGAI